MLKCIARKNRLSSFVTLTTEFQTASGSKVGTITVRQELHELGFHGVGWSGVKIAAIGLWSSGNTFS
jgi:hypothetical protein